MTTMFVGEVHDQKGDDIHEGDFVFTTRLREGSHEGKVETIVKDGSSARNEGVASYPEVIYTDQNRDRVAHTPNTLLKPNRRVFE
ncbi:hypothetical protein LTR66_015989 [Elasticomyces elasticus]|nr:hypothetical protein LTR66_015989 [Elasticomyces elasticus]